MPKGLFWLEGRPCVWHRTSTDTAFAGFHAEMASTYNIPTLFLASLMIWDLLFSPGRKEQN